MSSYPWLRHAEVFVLSDSGRTIRVYCDCPDEMDHYFEKDIAERGTPDQIARLAEISVAVVNAIDPSRKLSDVCESIVCQQVEQATDGGGWARLCGVVRA